VNELGDVSALAPSVVRVFAVVEIDPETRRAGFLERIRDREMARDPEHYERVAGSLLDPEKLRLLVSLSAEIDHGKRIQGEKRWDLGISGPRRGIGAIWHRYHGPLPDDPAERDELLQSHRVGVYDIEDAINQMLGRDPALHRPPRLSWGNLVKALVSAGVNVTEEDLIAAPLVVELSPEVQAELAAP
jgi:hypothetical protein